MRRIRKDADGGHAKAEAESAMFKVRRMIRIVAGSGHVKAEGREYGPRRRRG